MFLDLFRTENLVAITKICSGQPVDGAVARPSVRDHDNNIEACIRHLGKLTRCVCLLSLVAVCWC